MRRQDDKAVLVVDDGGRVYRAHPGDPAPRREGRTTSAGPGAVVLADVDVASEAALARGVPAAATPAGLTLLATGCRDVQPWSAPDGTGPVAVVGTVPSDPVEQRVVEGEVLAALGGFLALRQEDGIDEARCRTAIRMLREAI